MNMMLNKDRARILQRRRYAISYRDLPPVVVNPLGAYIQLDAKDQLRMLKMRAGEEIKLGGETGEVVTLRRTS